MNTVTAPRPVRHDAFTAWAHRSILSVTAVALLLVGIDTGGPLRSLTTAFALLVAPGLAASLVMGRMSVEARILISLAGSAVLLTAVAMVMALIGSWSPTTGLWIVVIVSTVLVLVSFLRSDEQAPNGEASDNSNHSTAETTSPPHDGVECEGGSDHD